ncbi:c-type cytochrome [Halotalea alkalilenta]|uniref:c-type cytochrome n=1 Tax=Halotalea alkalilenta TaxID=376489 RepID=UPI000488D2F9|nr:cytochrome c [Halotalea alkalilenta]
MKRTLLTLSAVGLALYASLGAVLAHAQGATEYDQVEKGRYLSTLGDCAACHTAPGGKPFAGGVAINTPFGKLVAPNITPDDETGLGKWTFDDFQRVMSEGRGPGGYHLYGAMPYTAYTKVSEEDNRAIWTYLQTLDPVDHLVVANQLPFPFNQRFTLWGWNLLNFDKGEFEPNPEKSAEWNRGAYLVEGLGHCGTCHTPKNLIGGDKSSQFLEGSVVDDWYAPDITADPHKGIGAWSEQDLVDYLSTGKNRFDIASGPMAEEVEHSSQYWNEDDLRAVATYLKDGRNADAQAPTPLAAEDPRMVSGGEIYADRCAGCHTPNGAGVEGLFPRLADTALVNGDSAASLMRVVLAGSRAGATDAAPTAPSMPAFAWNLSDEEISNVLTFVRNTWGNAAAPVSPSDVAEMRETLEQH